jgi:SEC-C motif-containing protein
MRSRYAAYAIGDLDYVWRTWHPRTRPDDLTPDAGLMWTGLVVHDAGTAGDDRGWVSFTASYTLGDGTPGELREHSRFERRAGHWLYVDGDVA